MEDRARAYASARANRAQAALLPTPLTPTGTAGEGGPPDGLRGSTFVAQVAGRETSSGRSSVGIFDGLHLSNVRNPLQRGSRRRVLFRQVVLRPMRRRNKSRARGARRYPPSLCQGSRDAVFGISVRHGRPDPGRVSGRAVQPRRVPRCGRGHSRPRHLRRALSIRRSTTMPYLSIDQRAVGWRPRSADVAV